MILRMLFLFETLGCDHEFFYLKLIDISPGRSSIIWDVKLIFFHVLRCELAMVYLFQNFWLPVFFLIF